MAIVNARRLHVALQALVGGGLAVGSVLTFAAGLSFGPTRGPVGGLADVAAVGAAFILGTGFALAAVSYVWLTFLFVDPARGARSVAGRHFAVVAGLAAAAGLAWLIPQLIPG